MTEQRHPAKTHGELGGGRGHQDKDEEGHRTEPQELLTNRVTKPVSGGSALLPHRELGEYYTLNTLLQWSPTHRPQIGTSSWANWCRAAHKEFITYIISLLFII